MDTGKLIQELLLKGYRMTVEEGRLAAARTEGLCKLLECVVPEGPIRAGITTLKEQSREHGALYREQTELFQSMLDHLQKGILDLEGVRNLFEQVTGKDPKPPTFCQWLVATESEEHKCLREAVVVSISEGYLRLACNADDVLLDMTENKADPAAFPALEAARGDFYNFLHPTHKKAGPWVRKDTGTEGERWHRYNMDAQTVATAEGTNPMLGSALRTADEKLTTGGWVLEHEAVWFACGHCVWMGEPSMAVKNECPECRNKKLQYCRGTIYEYLQMETDRGGD